jgi:dynactin complex subunit
MAPLTPGKLGIDEVAVGDTVDVPGNMQGVVRFVGSVQGKKGVFAGVELHADFASRGKNNGDVDGYVNQIFCSSLRSL